MIAAIGDAAEEEECQRTRPLESPVTPVASDPWVPAAPPPVPDIVTVEGTTTVDAGAKLGDGHGPSNGILANQASAVVKSLSNSSSSSSALSSDKAIEAIDAVNHQEEKLQQVTKRSRTLEKIIFVMSLSSLILMAYALVVLQWLLPYYYAVSAPLLIGLRIGLYIKYKWQYFLIDFCYFGNTLLYIFLWATPWLPEFFLVLFGLAHGPLAWATVLFRNSLVFHNTDKMTSVYIHVLPLFVTYGIRWYPDRLSQHWYTSFMSTFSEDVTYMFIWLIAVSFAAFMFHMFLYLVIVYAVCRPDNSYLNSYRYLSSRGGWILAMLSVCGQRQKFLMYSLFNCFYCILSLLFTVICYKYFVVDCIYLAFIVLVVAWNGAAFYIDVFPIKGFGYNI